jgi:hypothetical protein
MKHRFLFSIEGKHRAVLEALNSAELVNLVSVFLVETDNPAAAALLVGLETAEPITRITITTSETIVKEVRPHKHREVRNKRCNNCHMGIAGEDGLCTTCRNAERRAAVQERLDAGVEKVVMQARQGEALSGHKVG